jgi:hypothetical protein
MSDAMRCRVIGHAIGGKQQASPPAGVPARLKQPKHTEPSEPYDSRQPQALSARKALQRAREDLRRARKAGMRRKNDSETARIATFERNCITSCEQSSGSRPPAAAEAETASPHAVEAISAAPRPPADTERHHDWGIACIPLPANLGQRVRREWAAVAEAQSRAQSALSDGQST